jgi:hypothetical protein
MHGLTLSDRSKVIILISSGRRIEAFDGPGDTNSLGRYRLLRKGKKIAVPKGAEKTKKMG